MKDIGKVIESRLQILNMTQSELASQLNLNQRSISNYVCGKSFPSLETLVDICNILKIDLSYILETKEYSNTDFLLADKNEISLINHFRNVNEHDKETLLALAKILSKQKHQ